MIKNWFRNIGPGPLVAAAFIGPGTVTVCTLAGVQFGYSLLWAMGLSVIATIVLQEMAARLGIITQKGLSEVIRKEISNTVIRNIILVLILAAIFIGNTAYEAGNISGSILGLESLFGIKYIEIGQYEINMYSLWIGIIAGLLLYSGNYKMLEKVLISLVIIMSLAFLITAIITKPNLIQLFKGLFVPNFSQNNMLTVIALVGTTVVPYNLFLHAALVKEKWRTKEALPTARKDSVIAVILGGLVSMSIIVTAAASELNDILSAGDLASGLEPLFGNYASYFLSIGLFSAGITSAITAPLAAAYVVSGCLGWQSDLKSNRFKLVWALVLFVGVMFSSIGFKSIEIIKFAQVANGLLLPVIAGILIWIMNRTSILGKYTNSLFQNAVSLVILILTIFLGVKTILKVFDLW